MVRRASRGGSLVALGFFLARRDATAVLGLVLGGACVVGFGGLSVVMSRRATAEAVAGVPLLASSALAFGVGVLVAFAASTRAFRRDEDDGVRALLSAHGLGASEYLAARVLGLTVVLAVLVAGGSALVGVVAILTSHGRVAALHALQSSLAAVAFGLAFAVTFAPVAMATLGARSRGGGYLALLLVLVLPELLEGPLERVLSPAWVAVLSIPGALLTLRTSLAPVGVDLAMLSRAVIALLAIILGALAVVRVELLRARRAPQR